MTLPPDMGIVDREAKPEPKSPEDVILDALRAQIKVVEDEKAANHIKVVKQEEAESLRKQLRSYGLVPVA
jgi:hypothetical protein